MGICPKDLVMKKLLLVITLLASMPSFAYSIIIGSVSLADHDTDKNKNEILFDQNAAEYLFIWGIEHRAETVISRRDNNGLGEVEVSIDNIICTEGKYRHPLVPTAIMTGYSCSLKIGE